MAIGGIINYNKNNGGNYNDRNNYNIIVNIIVESIMINIIIRKIMVGIIIIICIYYINTIG